MTDVRVTRVHATGDEVIGPNPDIPVYIINEIA